ncbi:GntR family transcriptional regulator [Bordetella genomosp. 10]|uniref:GntR family transcriptional regulator n=1 Tax=Bordetella genomosp. 10 TaxID=1416804 RepID=A0A261S4V5_9BORD|nr:GntR family transcriptional regulator [Bordetella genomosp. 10]
MTAPIVRQALYLEAAERLRGMIRSRVLAAGEWVDELRLAAQLGISRTPLREALKLLASEGLVRLEPRRGCFVNELSRRDLDEIFPLMAMLEGRCAYEAARKAGPDDLARLRGLHDTLQAHAAAGDIDAYYDANYVIHEAIQALADNRWLSDMIGNLRKVLSLSRHKSLALPGRIQASCAEHMAIYAAIAAHDAEGAEALARGHLLRQLDALRILDARQPRTILAPGLAPAAHPAAAPNPGPTPSPNPGPTPAPNPDPPEPAHEPSATASPRARRAHL